MIIKTPEEHRETVAQEAATAATTRLFDIIEHLYTNEDTWQKRYYEQELETAKQVWETAHKNLEICKKETKQAKETPLDQ
ncbi:MAG: hypothetical protein GY811_06040 [Myxococcales bacterium]|nr:hypothetical protein [Myxococcales bacterium]